MSELKRCPLCGGEAMLLRMSHTMENFVNKPTVVCKDCGLSIENTCELIAVKKWNTRKPLERIVERLEILCDEAQDKLSDDFVYYDGWGDGVDMATRVVKEEGGIND